jgi:hypothetical protein
MREDDSLGYYLPVLRRIIILVAVIIAVPVILWTITTFVRTYVGPPRLPTFHQLASTASINAPSPSTDSEGAPSQDATARSGPILEANAAPDAGDSVMPTGSTPDDRSADQDSAVPDSSGPTGALASAQPNAGAYDTSESAASASPPLSGPIPLPRRRPREAEMRTAEMTPANVPMPRRRPESAGPSMPAEATGGSRIGFIQNLFH